MNPVDPSVSLRAELTRLEAAPVATADTLLQIGRLRAQLGDFSGAEKAARNAWQMLPGQESLALLGRILVHTGRLQEAITLVQSTGLMIAESFLWRALHSIGQGSVDTALQLLEAGISRFPRSAELLIQRAAIFLAQSKIAEALQDLKAAHAADPRNVSAWLMLARTRLVVGDAAGAEQCLRNAEQLQPALPAQACFQMAGVLQERKAFVEAEPYYRRAIAADPGNFLYRGNYADMLCSIGRIEEGMAQHREVLTREPFRLRSHLALGLTLPGVMPDASALHAARTKFAAALGALSRTSAEFAQLPREQIESDIRWSNYLLAYHGENDRPLQEEFSALQSSLLAVAVPTVDVHRVAGRQRLRIGFASSFFYQCTVGWYFSSWIKDISREKFDVCLYSLGPNHDALTDSLAEGSKLVRAHHLGLRSLVELLRRDELDILVFPELGLCPTTFALASQRHAPLQCAGWGHPVTSGHKSIDLFFSSEDMEPEDAANHYTEELIRLPGMGTRYAMPDVDFSLPDRATLGLPSGVDFAVVSQSLFKVHPDADKLYIDLLAALPSLHCVFFEDSFNRNTTLFRDRFLARANSLGVMLESRIHFLGRMNRQNFLAVNRHALMMLDSLHWSGGNTSLDALACGLPIVTRPGRFMRGRQSMAMLKTLECEELIARDEQNYVQIAIRLMEDRPWRNALSERILANRSRLFNQTEGVRAFEATLLHRSRR